MTRGILDGTVPAYWSLAVCNTGDASLVETFYPEHGGSYSRARALCARCPVSAECLAHTMATEDSGSRGRHGFAGGLTPSERYALAGTGARR